MKRRMTKEEEMKDKAEDIIWKIDNGFPVDRFDLDFSRFYPRKKLRKVMR